MQGQTTPPDTCWQASCVNGRTEALSGTSAEVRDLPDRLEVSRRLNGAHSSIGRPGSRALQFPFASAHANLTSLQSEVTCERCTHDVARGRLRKVERLTIVYIAKRLELNPCMLRFGTPVGFQNVGNCA